MIAMIKVLSDRIVKRDLADKLGLIYLEIDRLGRKDRLEVMNDSYHYYYDELEKVEIENDDGTTDIEYYPKNSEDDKKKEVSSYYRYNRVENASSYVLLSSEEQLVDLIDFAPIATGIEYKILKTIIPKELDMQNMQIMLDKVQSKIDSFQKQVDAFSNHSFNQKVNVHMAGGMISMYNDLMLKENCCTDELQGVINDGWRIIATCVQPDQRRPDYILGRYNPNLSVNDKEYADR